MKKRIFYFFVGVEMFALSVWTANQIPKAPMTSQFVTNPVECMTVMLFLVSSILFFLMASDDR